MPSIRRTCKVAGWGGAGNTGRQQLAVGSWQQAGTALHCWVEVCLAHTPGASCHPAVVSSMWQGRRVGKQACGCAPCPWRPAAGSCSCLLPPPAPPWTSVGAARPTQTAAPVLGWGSRAGRGPSPRDDRCSGRGRRDGAGPLDRSAWAPHPGQLATPQAAPFGTPGPRSDLSIVLPDPTRRVDGEADVSLGGPGFSRLADQQVAALRHALQHHFRDTASQVPCASAAAIGGMLCNPGRPAVRTPELVNN
jgi:hypothetical protein